ncbi:paraquat-inducible protein A [Allohahella marinimesophila]|uniref:Paraquat-inducible protein A n=1 Tax=Allohahella marinimesophila TaxID=1054972 RepID=A0ABP7NIV7_9GAMM
MTVKRVRETEARVISHGTSAAHDLTACQYCDLLLQLPTRPSNHALVCPRCRQVVAKAAEQAAEKVLAVSLAGLILFVPASFLPLLMLEAGGYRSATSLLESGLALFRDGQTLLAALLLLFCMILPLCRFLLCALCAGSIFVHNTPDSSALRTAFRQLHWLTEWDMTAVFMLGILVAGFKLADMAALIPGAGLLCFSGLLLCSVLLTIVSDDVTFWRLIARQVGLA